MKGQKYVMDRSQLLSNYRDWNWNFEEQEKKKKGKFGIGCFRRLVFTSLSLQSILNPIKYIICIILFILNIKEQYLYLFEILM